MKFRQIVNLGSQYINQLPPMALQDPIIIVSSGYFSNIECIHIFENNVWVCIIKIKNNKRHINVKNI